MYYHSGSEWDLGAMAMKEYSALHRALALLKSHHQTV